MTRPTLDDKSLGLFIREQSRDLSVRKSIKVKLPIRQHIRLHALKLFTENNISATVERALDVYFQQMNEAAGELDIGDVQLVEARLAPGGDGAADP